MNLNREEREDKNKEENREANANPKEEQIGAARRSGRAANKAVSSEAVVQFIENQANYEWLTTPEAAAILRITPKSLWHLTSNGKIRFYKFGRRNRFLLSDLNELLLAQPRGSSYGN